jgi:hypothetical protein
VQPWYFDLTILENEYMSQAAQGQANLIATHLATLAAQQQQFRY